MIIRIIRFSTEAVVDVQELKVEPDTQLIEVQVMADVRLRTLKEYEPPPKVDEEPH
ncbi:MAG TPA: hypothetical protein VGY48_15600 [Vicinamibacterales bacterium]|jgi:hypothetical protein|nr:hypothetical protein [Vicinamibacterales bacterium]